MPNYKGHIAGGLTAYILVLYALYQSSINFSSNYKELIFWLLLCIGGALFPDIDTKSKGQKLFYSLLFFIVLWAIFSHNWIALSIASMMSIIPALSRHRGISHNTWFVIFIPLLVPITISLRSNAFNKHAFSAYLFFVTGAISHLVLDFGLARFWKRTFRR